MNAQARFLRILCGIISAALVWVAGVGHALAFNVEPIPLELANAAKPNVILTFDDSGSMRSAYISSSNNTKAGCSSHYNKIYYNPRVTYTAPPAATALPTDPSPATLGDHSFTGAERDGYKGNNTVNLSTSFVATRSVNNNGSVNNETTCGLSAGGGQPDGKDAQPAYYLYFDVTRYTGGGSSGPICDKTDSAHASDNDCYSVRGVGDNTGEEYDTTLGTCSPVSKDNDGCWKQPTYDDTITGCNETSPGTAANPRKAVCWRDGIDERVNFANWYSYYRTRSMLSKAAAALAFFKIEKGAIRLAYQHLNACDNAFGQNPTTSCPGQYLRIFGDGIDGQSAVDIPGGDTTSPRADFFNWLYGSPANGYTPLREAAIRAGTYLSTTNTYNPFAKLPGPATAVTFNSNTLNTGVVTPEASCRQNFHVIFTDGAWNRTPPSGSSDSTPTTLSGRNDNDDGTDIAAGGLPDCPTCDNPPAASPAYDANTAGFHIFGDSYNDTLADIAFFYWKTDARAGGTPLLNDVPSFIKNTSGTASAIFWDPENDPAYWQHMVTFTVGLGVSGNLTFPDDEDNLKKTATPNKDWGDVYASSSARIDDLWHTAINGRGGFFSADDPTKLTDSFNSIITRIQSRSATSSPVAASGAELITGSRIFQVIYKSGDWFGRLLSFRLNTTNGDFLDQTAGVPDAEWDTSATTSYFGTSQNGTHTNRIIITRDLNAGTPAGIAFTWAALQTNYAAEFNNIPYASPVAADTNGNARVDYVRGDATNEGAGLDFRARNSTKIGDIVNAAPIYVPQGSDFNYPDGLESVNHSTFRTSIAARTPVVWVAGNDGALHGFDASFDGANLKTSNSGKEVLAYVPGTLLAEVGKLSSKAYEHQWFVDATPTVGDAFGAFPGCPSSPCWRTILVGGLGGGGKAIYALDVTDPSSFTQANANLISLWEKNSTSTGFGQLGETFSKPVIARIRKGDSSSNRVWAAIFGNGYNSAGGTARIYIVDIVTGALIKEIDTGVGSDNGLSTPAVVTDPSTTELVIDYIFAGDIDGNMWKFNIKDNDKANWAVAYDTNTFATTGGTPLPLFKAVDSGGTAQSITSKPEVGSHPDGRAGFMLYFGTGRFLTTGDINLTSPQVHTFYGVWDQNDDTITSTPVARSDLLVQTITNEVTETTGDFRISSTNSINFDLPDNHRGWRMDLIFGTANGERVLSSPVLSRGRIIFNSFIPNKQECNPEGDSWLMELDARTGQSLDVSPFDVNGDGFACACSADLLTIGSVPSGKKRKGRHGTPTIILDRTNGQEYKYETGSGSTSGSLAPKRIVEHPGSSGSGRGSWKQLR